MSRRLVAMLLVVIVIVLAVAPGSAAAGGALGPRAMLYAYYGLINARSYWPAYQQWVSPPQTYAQFVAGYGDTASVVAYFGGFQPGAITAIEGRVPGVLIGYRSNGTVAAFSGCYSVRYNPAASGMAQWLITGANFQPMPIIPTDTATIWQQALDMWCYGDPGFAGSYSSVQQMLLDYIEAVNRADYGDAYALWANPPQTYEQFVVGWADTTETVLFYGAYQYSGVYGVGETGRVPVVMMGYHTDGSLVAYQGCLGVSYDAALLRRWSLWRTYLRPMVFSTTPDTYAVFNALAASCY